MANNKKDNEDQPEGNSGNADDSADNFGLPDIEYKPLDRDQTTKQVHETSSYQEPDAPTEREEEKPRNTGYSVDDDEPRSNAPLFIGLIIGVVILVAGFLLYKYWYVPKAEKEKIELARIQKEKDDAAAAAAKLKADAEQKRLDSIAALNAKPTTGTIETLTARTKRWFVIVTSDIDDDLVMDYAKKLSAKGVSSKIIPPYGSYKYFRLGIADFETFSEAQTSADTFKGEYGSAVWVMKY